jgi:tetratricopeptide (TPR) repeat protein
MQQPAGELIRQLRRQRSLTQTELGGDQFSKSYVSAVERGKITPSAEALRFFAQQLGQPQEAFFALVQSPEAEQFLVTHPLPFLDYADLQEKLIALLDILLESTEQYSAYLFQLHEIPELPPEILLALPKETQAHYYFLTGLIAQEKQDLTTALYDFEQALALAPAKHQPAILDNIGINYYLTRKYQTALGYHKRALHSEQEEAKYGTASRLQLKLELHCAMDYQAMNAYDKAYMHYERARQQLNSTHDMNTVGQLYLGMGYCTYAYIYENMAHQSSKREPITTEEMEIEFQNAISFLLQSRTIYQICADHLAEVKVRLMHSMVLLDLSAKRRQIVQGKKCTSNILRLTNNITLLESVQQECQQVHMRWKDVLKKNFFSFEFST